MKRIYVVTKYILASSLDMARRMEKGKKPDEIYLYQGTAPVIADHKKDPKLGFVEKK